MYRNMDRLLAIWQAIYPNSWIDTSQINEIGTFTDAPGSYENVNTRTFRTHSIAPTDSRYRYVSQNPLSPCTNTHGLVHSPNALSLRSHWDSLQFPNSTLYLHLRIYISRNHRLECNRRPVILQCQKKPQRAVKPNWGHHHGKSRFTAAKTREADKDDSGLSKRSRPSIFCQHPRRNVSFSTPLLPTPLPKNLSSYAGILIAHPSAPPSSSTSSLAPFPPTLPPGHSPPH